jgi:hypothetical protein
MERKWKQWDTLQNAYLRRQDCEKPMDLGACLYWANLNSNRNMLLFHGVPHWKIHFDNGNCLWQNACNIMQLSSICVCVTDACIRKHILRALISTMEPTTATTVLAFGLVLVFSDSMMKLDGGNTKGRWSRRGSKASPCKGWLCVKACCVQKLLFVNCFLCKGIYG